MKDTTLTASQIKTLRAIAQRGGEFNAGYVGYPGINGHSVDALRRKGYFTSIGTCVCRYGGPCDREHADLVGQVRGHECYGRVRLNAAAYAALAEVTT